LELDFSLDLFDLPLQGGNFLTGREELAPQINGTSPLILLRTLLEDNITIDYPEKTSPEQSE
jgi:hypothetical protein